jgi:outer membrane receptor protein involved in Fe transport
MLETAGIDVQVNWSAEMADLGLDMIPGQLGITFLANYLDKYVVQELATSPAEDWAGTTGEGHQYEYRTFTTLTYRNDTFSVNLRHRYLPSLDHSSIVRNPATTTQGPGDYHIFDLSGRYSLTEVLELRAGIDNLFDRDPVITARSPTSSGTGTTNAEYYDVLGRRFYVGLKARF